MKLEYVTPEIELDDFVLEEALCANLYGRKSGGPEFYAVGGNNAATASDERFVGEAGGDIDFD